MELDELLDMDQVRAILGVRSRSTIYALEEKGLLHRVNGLGFRGVRFRKSDVATLIRRREAATPIPGSTVKEVFMDDLETTSLADTQAAAVKRAREDDELVRLLDQDGTSDA
jgi:predicted DNA-binding transcriptional regulator AlpA